MGEWLVDGMVRIHIFIKFAVLYGCGSQQHETIVSVKVTDHGYHNKYNNN